LIARHEVILTNLAENISAEAVFQTYSKKEEPWKIILRKQKMDFISIKLTAHFFRKSCTYDGKLASL